MVTGCKTINNNKSRSRSERITAPSAPSNASVSEHITPSAFRAGYIALVSLLVVSSVIFVIGMALAMTGIGEAQMGLAEERGHRSFSLAEGCAEDALLAARDDAGYDDELDKPYPEGSCDIVVDKSGSDWTITVSAEAADTGHTKKVEVKINRGATITVTGWKETE